jgi:hypothetical protein
MEWTMEMDPAGGGGGVAFLLGGDGCPVADGHACMDKLYSYGWIVVVACLPRSEDMPPLVME